jgi:hypothetical protein
VSREGLCFESSARYDLKPYFRNWKASVVRTFQPGDIANLEETDQIVRIHRLPDWKLGVAIHLLLRVEPEFTEAPEHSNGNK